ncbi:hypothetical protein CLCR_02175 [Cladophialophora carrionii]|uniref:Uncharacterized protein n=2 Tax=Cladophialophora carrionii TaxID=86049 RepID=A0A1C1CE37_9EURO|nr:hypothetical protein CLCR_02175 [Cladophialophora carrionii]
MLATSAVRSTPLRAAARTIVRKTTTRAASSTSNEAASPPFWLTAGASTATVAAIGSVAWYYHLFGQDVYAMTPAEEG